MGTLATSQPFLGFGNPPERNLLSTHCEMIDERTVSLMMLALQSAPLAPTLT
jgi:hypothetical protein